MKVVVVAGGSGSKQVQRALNLLDIPPQDVTILINMYDNGKSTGEVRRLAHGAILGPSDLRKNQVFCSRMLNARRDQPSAELEQLCTLLEKRVPASQLRYCIRELEAIIIAMQGNPALYTEACYELTVPADAVDFCFGNLLYGGLLAGIGDIYHVERLLAGLLQIPRGYVVVNSFENAYLYGETTTGALLPEEELVDHDGVVQHIYLYASEDCQKFVQPYLSTTAEGVLADADLVILSTGTFWSSLYPTYVTRGFAEAVNDKPIIGLVNLERDTDARHQPLHELCELTEKALGRSVEWYADADQVEDGPWDATCLNRNGDKHDVVSLAALFAVKMHEIECKH